MLKKKTQMMKKLIKLVNSIIIYYHPKEYYLNLIKMKMKIKNKNKFNRLK